MFQKEFLFDTYRKYSPFIFHKCLRLLKDEDRAKDATQEVFLRFFENIDKYRYGETPLPLLYTIANHYCINLFKKNQVRAQFSGNMESLVHEMRQASPRIPYENIEILTMLLRKLDDRTCEIVLAHFIDEMDIIEIANILSLSRKTVSKKIKDFLDRSKRILARWS